METARLVLELVGKAALQLVTGPFYYIAILFIVLQYRKQIRMERTLFAVKLHNWQSVAMNTVLVGIAAGIAVSTAGAFIGATITAAAALWLWAIAAILIVARIRFLCFAYSAGIIALLQWLVGYTGLDLQNGWTGELVRSLLGVDASGLLFIVALLHLAEALLVRWQGDRLSTPLFMEGKRGKLVGGYMLLGFWPVPLLLITPVSGDAAGESAFSLPWTPLLAAETGQSWTFVVLPMVIGFTELTRTLLPRDKARHAAKGLLLYSVVLAGAALVAWWQPFLLPLAGGAAIVLHEALVWRSQLAESNRVPLFVHDARGLRILGIVPGTPAHAMGLLPGEIIHKVNGIKVTAKEQLYDALAQNAAFCRLEVINLDGEPKFVQRARYEREHHQLGVILAPDEQADYYTVKGSFSLPGLLNSLRAVSRRKRMEESTEEGK